MNGTLTFTCQKCGATGTDRAAFKKIAYRGPISFSYILCNEHAKRHETETPDDRP